VAVYLKLLLAALFWGGTFVAGRAIAQDVGPFSISFLRFALASILLVMLAWRAEKRLPLPSRDQIIPLILLGLTGVFSYNSSVVIRTAAWHRALPDSKSITKARKKELSISPLSIDPLVVFRFY